MRKISVSFILIFLILAVSALLSGQHIVQDRFNTSQRIENRNYPDLKLEEEVGDKLEAAGIPHKIDKDGFLWYFRKDKAIVEMAYKVVNGKYFPDWDAVTFGHPVLHDHFVSTLTKGGIPFIIRKLDADGNDYILWDPMYSDEGNRLLKEMHQSIIGDRN